MGWSNVGAAILEAVTVIITTGTPGSGIFVYQGTPGPGTLVGSWTSAAGTDPYGNQYIAGATTYNPGISYAQLFNAFVALGPISGGVPQTGLAGGLSTNGANLFITSLTTASAIDASLIIMAAAANGVTVPNGTEPSVSIVDADAQSVTSAYISGVITPSDLSGTPLLTTVVGSGGGAPAYNTNWASNTSYGTVGTVESLRFESLATGHVHVHGAFKTGGSAPVTNTVFLLPSGYFRADRAQLFTWHGRIAPASNETIGTGTVGTSGMVALSSTNTGSTSPLVANSTYWVDFIVDGPGVY